MNKYASFCPTLKKAFTEFLVSPVQVRFPFPFSVSVVRFRFPFPRSPLAHSPVMVAYRNIPTVSKTSVHAYFWEFVCDITAVSHSDPAINYDTPKLIRDFIANLQ